MNFGYPTNCYKCNTSNECEEKNLELNVKPFYQERNNFRLMLIGQDPTIFVKKERVKQVLMLDEPNGQLRRWLENLLGKDTFGNFTVYATNLIKCTFPKPPSTYSGKYFLKPYFEICKNYLEQEVLNFRPNLILSFGEPAHRYFSSIFDNSAEIGNTMQSAFGNDLKFFKAKINGFEFSYSPSLHIKTFRVAETYGKKIEKFKTALKREIT
jgi:uracil-DNA glycosylase